MITFEHPPVTEVALGVQFEPVAQLTSAQVAIFWAQNLREIFPQFQEQPPLFPVIERFDEQPAVLSAAFQLGPMPTRTWLLTRSGSELIQIQSDRFIFNWRAFPLEPSEYPRYSHVRRRFDTYFAMLVERIAELGGEVVPQQCEVIYINHITADGLWQQHGQLDRVLAPWSGVFSDDFLSEPEAVQIQDRHIIRGTDNEPIGRLYVNVDPGFRASDHAPTFSLTLTARGAPQGAGVASVGTFLDIGHDWVVRGFKSFTSVEAHQLWGLTE
jgi:uncharacterized protein (TIGR04255 family)